MRSMVLVKATDDSEKGFVPTPEMQKAMEAMGRFNQELIKAGIMKAGNCEGLKPSSEGMVGSDHTRVSVGIVSLWPPGVEELE